MDRSNEQIHKWSSGFGKAYTDRNALTVEQMDKRSVQQLGVSRSELYKTFLGQIDHSIRILEVGSNIGNQLICLQELGFEYLYGIEIQRYAVELSNSRTEKINIIQGSAFDIPFKDRKFDLVFTSGLLIHIIPENLRAVLSEICRCTKHYILGYEYCADRLTEVLYREHRNMLWKADFARIYLENFKGLELVCERRIKYLQNDNVDSMFLIRKVI
jgi:pseudaminic acid biosynthesis-associated methylase